MLKTIFPGCGVQASLKLFFILKFVPWVFFFEVKIVVLMNIEISVNNGFPNYKESKNIRPEI